MKITKVFITLFFLLFSFYTFASSFNLKAISGKVHIYRDGVHFEYDGKKKLRPNDILHTFGKASITVEYRNFFVTLGPNTFFKLTPGQTREYILIGSLFYGNVFTDLSVVRTDKPYKIMATNFTGLVQKSQTILTVARNKREAKLMYQGKTPGAPDNLEEVTSFQSLANITSKVLIVKGKGQFTLKNKTVKNLLENDLIEFRAEGSGLKEKALSVEEINNALNKIGFELPSFKRQK